MCLYDVKRAKNTETVGITDDFPVTQSPLQVCGGNANRTRLIVAAMWEDNTNPVQTVVLSNDKDGKTIIGILTVSKPYLVLRLEDIGTGVMGAVWAFWWQSGNVSLRVSEAVLLKNDELQ